MIRYNKYIIAAGAAALSAGIYSASTLAASVTSTANATVIAPMTIGETQALDFGDIAEDGTGGTVALDASTGARTPGGGASASAGGGDQRGIYAITGVAGKTYSISIPGINLTGPGGATMSVVFTNDAALTIPGAGSDNIGVGGTITLGAGQTAGNYSGNYTVTVDYN
ncbi:MAG: DUF4402 domain-containing protein [Thiotrichales bacterium]|nr:MAG: DUF4402 domain-containing protein [Thiotrichales bacterium]